MLLLLKEEFNTFTQRKFCIKKHLEIARVIGFILTSKKKGLDSIVESVRSHHHHVVDGFVYHPFWGLRNLNQSPFSNFDDQRGGPEEA